MCYARSGQNDEAAQWLPYYVKKGVSWALRHIGKRNPALHEAALATAVELRGMESKPARWIGNDAVRDLTSETSLRRLEKQRSQT